KLLNSALVSSHTNEYSESHMATQEKKMYHQLIEVLNNYTELFGEIFSGNGNHSDSKSSKSDSKDLEKLPITILEDVSSFIGSDMVEYGPFKKDETISLPYKISKLLISRNLGSLKD
ncbi:MAG: hypothetical protein Q7K42_00205, partial [Candidatus Diapherotrites archaeon]|nr:hypothetical protein [Candidatus Diapherotrites archaeon]